MRRFVVFCTTVIFGIGLALATAGTLKGGEAEDGFVPMFNGKDLTGWEGVPGAWEVRDGAIVAESTPERPS